MLKSLPSILYEAINNGSSVDMDELIPIMTTCGIALKDRLNDQGRNDPTFEDKRRDPNEEGYKRRDSIHETRGKRDPTNENRVERDPGHQIAIDLLTFVHNSIFEYWRELLESEERHQN